MKEPVQSSQDNYYGMAPPTLESNHNDSGSSTGVYNPDKGAQGRLHYQQAAPVKWMHQDPIQGPGWSQEAPVPAWGPNFATYAGGVRGQMAFHKGGHDVGGVQLGAAETQPPGSVEVYREATQAQAQVQAQAQTQVRGLVWHQAQLQTFQPHGHKDNLQADQAAAAAATAAAAAAAAAAADSNNNNNNSSSSSSSSSTAGASSSVLPRRSRRLSRDGQSPGAMDPWTPPPPLSKNGLPTGTEAPGTTGGVIKSPRRRRRASKEINLETLAQQASERESLPAKGGKLEERAPAGRQTGGMGPLVIPVSVPVCGGQATPAGSWRGRPDQTGDHHHQQQHQHHPHRPAHSDHKLSVIVARRRSLRGSLSETQDAGGNHDDDDSDAKSKCKSKRPRPEPLFIPPPKLSTYIAPALYSSITTYQSHLRSPVRSLPDHPLALPPYTPPPILSPVRGGSGLYFSTFLSNIAAGNQGGPPPPTLALSSTLTASALLLPPPATPKSVSRSLLRSVEGLMNLACSSVFPSGGTNQELALHCLHQCEGNILETLKHLMHERPIFPKGHHMADYHYSGSDCWTASEKRYFNKGIAAYRKDFFMVQKLVRTKTVCQCVEFYYTYKKQVKMGRNGAPTYGPLDSPGAPGTTDPPAQVKAGSVVLLEQLEGLKKEPHPQAHPAPCPPQAPPRHRRQENPGTHQDLPGPRGSLPLQEVVFTKVKSRSAHMKSHAEQEKKASALRRREQEEEEQRAAAQARKEEEEQQQEEEKVKSRSAHMKSHAEQEKKASALRRREQEEEEQRAAAQARKEEEQQQEEEKVAAAVMLAPPAGENLEETGGAEPIEGGVGGSSSRESSEAEDENDADWQ
ncbi:hypothetical protein CRUP_037984 [Coryphaenoides rupestris]|nr:hypothetical protein CRUP_037984 [Coryphaenoides rupestris]